MIKTILGGVFILFVIMAFSFYSIHTHNVMDESTNITAENLELYNSTKAIERGNITFLNMIGYLLACLLFIPVLFIVINSARKGGKI